MISVEDALAEILRHVRPLPGESVPILESLGQVLTETIVSDVDIPPFDNSAMDGFALESAGVAGASRAAPTLLSVVGTVAAGYAAGAPVGPGTAIRIMTGAPMPDGADAVIPIEDTSDLARSKEERLAAPAGQIEAYTAVRSGENVRRAGEDVRRGEIVLEPGRVMRPQEIGVLASLGRATVLVHRRPRVAILATGDELVDPGEPLPPGKIRNSNEYTNAALVTRTGGVPLRLGVARDTHGALSAKLREGLDRGADLFLTSGGVSMGDYDVVKDVLDREGQMQFWQVSMRPGKPLAFGLLQGGVPLIGLPGNPVSAMVSFEQFARPAILKMLGLRNLAKPSVPAIADEDLFSGGRRTYIRVVATLSGGRYHVRATGGQGSGVLTSMAKANGLAVIPEGLRRIEAGGAVEVQMLDWPETKEAPL